MALNRMSALGMGKPAAKGPAESNAFVAFKNGTLPVAPDADKDKKRVFF